LRAAGQLGRHVQLGARKGLQQGIAERALTPEPRHCDLRAMNASRPSFRNAAEINFGTSLDQIHKAAESKAVVWTSHDIGFGNPTRVRG
jgi:hypothetical protein